MLYINLFLIVVKKEDFETILSKNYISSVTVKEIIVPKDGNEEHYCAIYSNFSNPLIDLKDKSLFSIYMELDYSANVENTICVNFKFKEVISGGDISEIEQFYILNGDERIFVDVSNHSDGERINRFVNELNRYSCGECIRMTNKLMTGIIKSADNSLKNPKETILE
jgi:hypothetical protein